MILFSSYFLWQDYCNYLANQQCSIPELIKGMILLNTLLPKWHSNTEIYLQENDEVDDIRFSIVKYAITNWWAQEQKTIQLANKLFAVKCRSGPPFFKQQQQHFSPNNNPKRKYRKYTGKLHVEKLSKGKQHGHSAIADIVYVVPRAMQINKNKHISTDKNKINTIDQHNHITNFAYT